MSGLSWYPHYTGDYARDTRQLSLIEHGAYRLLMDYYYSNGSLECGTRRLTNGEPNVELMPDNTRFYRLCGAVNSDEVKAVDYILERFFMYKNGIYTSEKIESILIEQLEKHARRVAASAAGVEARKKNDFKKSKGSTERATKRATKRSPNQNQNQNQIFGIDKSIPQYIAQDVWDSFMEVRHKQRAAKTDNALNLILKELEKLKSAGDDPNEAIKQSIMNGWKGVFPIKNNNQHGKSNNGKYSEVDSIISQMGGA